MTIDKAHLSPRALLRRGLKHHGYLSALGSSYLVMLASILVQIAIVPLYVHAFGQYQFGVLMVLLSLVNFAIIGIAWMSGGALRLLGEHAGQGDDAGFREAFGLIKTVYVAYGCVLASLIWIAALLFDTRIFAEASPQDLPSVRLAMLLMGLYLTAFYAVAVDRIALTARKCQALANAVQLVSLLVFAVGAILWVNAGGSMPGVIGLHLVSQLAAGLVSKTLLNRKLPGLAMRIPGRQSGGIMRRLGGRTGAGFFVHGALVLALQADIALVGWLGGAKAAAEFFLVWKIAEVLVQLIWKLPEPLAPYFVQMDVRGERAALGRIALLGYIVVAGVSLAAGILYALLGPAAVALWVGETHAPSARLPYLLAGGAIFWLGIARLPIVFAGARVVLRRLNLAGFYELCGKLAVTLLLFPRFGYLAVLAGINLAHLLGGSYFYFRLLRGSSVALQEDEH